MSKVRDLKGQRFGRLFVIELNTPVQRRAVWKCQCDCGNIIDVPNDRLVSGKTTSCGCARFINLQGKRFGKLTVVKFVGSRKHGGGLWECKCDCGNTKIISTQSLLHSNSVGTKSCGCLVNANHPNTHKKSKTRIYRIWQKMKQRCCNEHHKHYAYYGGRGIIVCPEWINDFEAFYDWAISNGYTDELTIDRIDSNGNYEPSNCRWATRKEQANNTRNNVYLTYQGETLSPRQWSEKLGINYSTIQGRRRKGLPIEQILSKDKLY